MGTAAGVDGAFAVSWTLTNTILAYFAVTSTVIHAMSDYLLVHGGFNGGWVWDQWLTERLEKAGHEVRVVDQLPSAGTDPASLGDLTTDANHVRQVLDTIDEPVVLVGHSYGGMVITELADHPKVRHSVYLIRVLAAPGPVLAGPAR